MKIELKMVGEGQASSLQSMLTVWNSTGVHVQVGVATLALSYLTVMLTRSCFSTSALNKTRCSNTFVRNVIFTLCMLFTLSANSICYRPWDFADCFAEALLVKRTAITSLHIPLHFLFSIICFHSHLSHNPRSFTGR